MADSVTQGEMKRFLRKNKFISTGKKNNRYIGVLNGEKRLLVFHYHKDSDMIPSGTLKAMAEQLGISKNQLVDLIKNR